jgi:hypothetical protein
MFEILFASLQLSAQPVLIAEGNRMTRPAIERRWVKPMPKPVEPRSRWGGPIRKVEQRRTIVPRVVKVEQRRTIVPRVVKVEQRRTIVPRVVKVEPRKVVVPRPLNVDRK